MGNKRTGGDALTPPPAKRTGAAPFSSCHSPTLVGADRVTARCSPLIKGVVKMSAHRDAGRRLPSLPAALRMGLNFGEMREEHRANQAHGVKMFRRFLVNRFGTSLIEWPTFVEGDYLRQYADHLKHERGLAFNSVRSKLNVVRLANRLMKKRFKADTIDVQEHVPKRRPLPKFFLTPPQYKIAVTEARATNNFTAELGFTVGFECGLNLEEICYIAEGDLAGDVLHIYDSKNEYRERLLVITKQAQELIRTALINRASSPRSGAARQSLFANYQFMALSMRRVLKRCAEKAKNAEDREAFETVKPRDMRKGFDNMCVDLKVRWELKEGYMGHRLKGEGDSYSSVRVTKKEPASVRNRCLSAQWTEIVAPIERLLRGEACATERGK